METELKIRSIRATEADLEKFKTISEEFPNQAQALAALISVYEIEKARAVLPERQTDIDNFASHVQKINESFVYSLQINHDAETRIRTEFARQLESKDLTIQDLQEKVKT